MALVYKFCGPNKVLLSDKLSAALQICRRARRYFTEDQQVKK